MPHINLLFPFVPLDEFDAAERLLSETLAPLAADSRDASLRFARIASFEHGNVHVAPQCAPDAALLARIYAACAQAIPFTGCEREKFVCVCVCARAAKKSFLLKKKGAPAFARAAALVPNSSRT